MESSVFAISSKDARKSISQKSVKICQDESIWMNVKKDIPKLAEDSKRKMNAGSKRIVPIATLKAGMIRKRTSWKRK